MGIERENVMAKIREDNKKGEPEVWLVERGDAVYVQVRMNEVVADVMEIKDDDIIYKSHHVNILLGRNTVVVEETPWVACEEGYW